jgi:hypothetical protein
VQKVNLKLLLQGYNGEEVWMLLKELDCQSWGQEVALSVDI